MKILHTTLLFVGCGILGLVGASAFAKSRPRLVLPAGWRLPFGSEVNQAWRSASPHRYLVVHGDFTGGQRQDGCLLLVRTNGSGFAPFVVLTQENGQKEFVQVEDTNDRPYLETEGIVLAKPGTYRTACGKGYIECGPQDKESITTSFDAIEFFKREGPARLIYWDPVKKGFAEAWLSD